MNSGDGKYTIGLTGNIGTGKSVVRKMLEHLGALGIDADALSHRAIYRDSPGYHQVLNTFGHEILDENRYINRARLGRIVFSNPEQLKHLEEIILPIVNRYLQKIYENAHQKIIVIEAINILESDIHDLCDSIWVTSSPQDVQLKRLVQNRHMNETDALQRIQAQPPQEQKFSKADVIIQNQVSFSSTWEQVNSAFQKLPPEISNTPQQEQKTHQTGGKPIAVNVSPSNIEEIRHFFNQHHLSKQLNNHEDVMALLSENKIIFLKSEDHITGLITWQTNNFIATGKEITTSPVFSWEKSFPLLEKDLQTRANDLLCDAILFPVAINNEQLIKLLLEMGYIPIQPTALESQALREAALKAIKVNNLLYLKYLPAGRKIFEL